LDAESIYTESVEFAMELIGRDLVEGICDLVIEREGDCINAAQLGVIETYYLEVAGGNEEVVIFDSNLVQLKVLLD
jgi:hypothetical protein